jgi:hypothetical protein
VPLGIEQDMGQGVAGQLIYPLHSWFGPLLARFRRTQN